MKKLVLFITCLMAVTSSLWAYNFSAVCETEQTLYYSYNDGVDGASVTVTYPGYGYTELSGNLVIPSSVTYGGKTYSVTSIGNSAFSGCTGLTSITIPNSVTSIGNEAFSGCTGLTSITIPNSVTTIGSYAFYHTGWWNNQSDGIIYKDGWCLGDKGNPTGAITIQNGTKGIADNAFDGCSGLTAVTIPNSVTSIGNYAFYECSGLTGSLTIPNSVTSIGSSAFRGCTGLTSITIPNSVTTIGDAAFANCTGLTSITIPNSVTSIGEYAFYYCLGLTSITCEAVTPPEIEDVALYFYDETYLYDIPNISLYVPAGSVQAYKEHAVWGKFTNISAIPYTITANSNDNNMGSVSGGGTYESGTNATITATPTPHYHFVQWNDGNKENPRQITVTEDKTYTATFAIDIYTVTTLVNNSNWGSVAGGGSYQFNATTTLTATPNNGYKFVSWNDGNTENPRNVTVTGNATYIASFAANEGTDAIAEATGSNAQIFGGEKRIIINNAENAMVAIYDVMGRTVVKEQRINTNNAVFAMPQMGIYIVRIGKAAKKVFVK